LEREHSAIFVVGQRSAPRTYDDGEPASTLPRRTRDGEGLSSFHAGGLSGGNVIEVDMLRLIALAAVIIAFLAAGAQV